MNGNYIYMLAVTLALLVFMCINHGRETQRRKIVKWGIYFLLLNEVFAALREMVLYDGASYYPMAVIYLVVVIYYLTEALTTILAFMYLLMLFPEISKKKNMLQTIFFAAASIAALAIVTTPITGFIYHIDNASVVFSVGWKLLYFGRFALLAAFLLVVLVRQSALPRKQVENLTVVLAVSLGMHVFPFLFSIVYPFGFFANAFFGMVYWLFHSSGYEEERAHMGADLYGRELDYCLSKKLPFFAFEVTVANCDYLMQRGCLSKGELMQVYEELFERMNRAYRQVMVFRKHPARIGVVAEGVSEEQAQSIAAQLKEWMDELFHGSLIYRIVGISCPQYGDNAADVEHLFTLLSQKCGPREIYFCSDADFEEFDARGDVLLFLQNICTEMQDVVLFVSPMIDKRNNHIRRFEIFGRAQMAGSGIVGSHRIAELAQQYGYSHDVNMAVLKNICEYLTTTADGVHVKVSLRISSDELESPGFADDVLDILKNYELEPETIGFEVKMEPGQRDIEGMLSMMQTLRDNGVMFILTDFSPSAVNFEGIAMLPFKTVKFESGCVRQAAENEKSFEVIGLLVDMLKERGFDVVFKGVEDEELEDTALSLGADYLEGTRYVRTLPLENIAQQLDLGGMF